MCPKDLPDDCQQAVVVSGGARSPLKLKELTSLRNAFLQVPGPRCAQSRRHPLSAMLTLIALGLLMGGRDMLNMWRKVAPLDQRQWAAIDLRVRSKESGLLTVPGYDALNDLMNALDPHAYAAALTD
jgi:hypothetical protein